MSEDWILFMHSIGTVDRDGTFTIGTNDAAKALRKAKANGMREAAEYIANSGYWTDLHEILLDKAHNIEAGTE